MTPYLGAGAWRPDEPRTQAERLATFVPRANREGISPAVRAAFKIRVLDSFDGAYEAIAGEPVRMLR